MISKLQYESRSRYEHTGRCHFDNAVIVLYRITEIMRLFDKILTDFMLDRIVRQHEWYNYETVRVYLKHTLCKTLSRNMIRNKYAKN